MWTSYLRFNFYFLNSLNLIFWLNLTYILKSDIRFQLNAHLNIYHWRKYYIETSFNMDFKKILFFFKIQISTAKLFKIAKHN